MVDWSLLGKGLYDLALGVNCCLVFIKGGTAERIGAAILVAGSGATALVFPITNGLLGIRGRFAFLAIDLAVFIAFDILMARSTSRWPVWMTGFQLAAVALSIAAASSTDLESARLYMFIQGKFAYLMLAALLSGTFGRRPSRSPNGKR